MQNKNRMGEKMYLLVFLSVAESVSSFSLLLFQMFHSKGKPANSNNNELIYLKEQKKVFFLIIFINERMLLTQTERI